MGKPGAFLTYDRVAHELRPVSERIRDFGELYREPGEDERRRQASRCMMCGVAFCQAGVSFGRARVSGCPLHNLIPEWNDLAWRGRWREAAARLSLTNPLPEFTSRVCPALCEAACNLNVVEGKPTAIHDTERFISDWEWSHGGPRRFAAPDAGAPRVAVVGSGPAGLACAWELARAGIAVTVHERDDRPGGLLTYGIPNMKLDKRVVERRVGLMRELGIDFSLGFDACSGDAPRRLTSEFDAVVLACGSRTPRGLAAAGSDAKGVVYALDYLTAATKAVLGGGEPVIDAHGLDVLVIGGGDTGNDCIATAIRQGASSVRQIEIMPEPPAEAGPGNPWPEWPQVKKTDYGQEEAIALAGEEIRAWSVDTREILVDTEGAVRGAVVADVDWAGGSPAAVEGTERTLDAQLVILACGFTGPEQPVLRAFGVALPEDPRARKLPVTVDRDSHLCVRANTRIDAAGPAAELPVDKAAPVYVCGDARTGSSLVVSAIADAVACSREIIQALGYHSVTPV